MSNNFVELLLLLGVNNTESINNLNNEIKKIENNSKLKKLDLVLGINQELSINNIKSQIQTLQKNLPQLDVSFNVKSNSVDTKMFTNTEKQINTLQSKLNSTEDEAKRALKSVADLNMEIARSNGRIKVVDDSTTGKVKEVVTVIKNELGQLEKKVYRPVVDIKMGDDGLGVNGLKEVTRVLDSSIFENFNKKATEAKLKLDEFERQGKLSEKSLNSLKIQLDSAFSTEDLDKFISKMNQMGKIESHGNKWNEATKNIKNQTRESIAQLEKMKESASFIGLDTRQYDHLIGKMKQMSNINITNDAQISKAEKAMGQFSTQISNLKNNTASYTTSFNTLFGALDKAAYQGLMTANSIDTIKLRVLALNGQNITLDEKLRTIRTEAGMVNEQFTAISRNNKIEEKTQKLRNEMDKLGASLTRTVNSYKRTVNMDMADSIRNELTRMSNNIPAFDNLKAIEKYGQDVKRVENQIRSLQAEATRSARANLGVIEAFKVAMERFPIWMAASTAFYGTIRTAREFVTTLIDIDTKLVSISKVMSDDMDMAEIFDRATQSAETFGKSITEALDAYIEFARQGFKGEDLGFLADSGLVASNVGELSAQKASEYMTASLVQWDIDAKDSMKTIDSLIK